ncbi:uncharacterized protein KD926_001873 [Aspergillus affinis]|uniref:uncharacterized protein n=1 Tax=Aspergillus affinis TaxID=1070780 RepID=UPI0022FF1212|nr:uncharacterized protein KD926_001873 [Aspergillus affinis]KAI9044051.1 hypothetical protein KD926_001873 [Aspergillus affinis]
MGDAATILSASFTTRLSHDKCIHKGDGVKSAFDIKFFWSPVDDSPRTHREDYSLVFLDVNINGSSGAGSESIESGQNDGLQDLLSTIKSSTSLVAGETWNGRVLLVVPARSGYLARTKIFEQRFIGCSDLGLFQDRTVFGGPTKPGNTEDFRSLLDSSVLFIVRPNNDQSLIDETAVIEEVHSRINFEWLLDAQPKETKLAIVDGHLNLPSYLPFFNSASALGIKFVLLDKPDHWLTDPSLQHLYHDFVPIDMTPNEEFHLRIAEAVKAYGPVDGICAIASYCLLPVAKAATILGLPTELPEAVACAVNKYETRLLAGGAEPTTLVSSASELEEQITRKEFAPQYPSIVKPGSGTGSAHVYRADNETELLEGVRRTCEGSSKKALIEAFIEGPESDVNFVLLDGKIIFFEISDDFPSPGDNGTIDSDFWENTNVLPSKLPADEYTIVRDNLHQVLLKMGLKTGVFHLEARVQNSSMEFTEKDGIIDLRPAKTANNNSPRCFLIEVNPRPPGMPVVLTSAGAYGVNMYDLHLLASLGDYQRFRGLAKAFDQDTIIPYHARAWSQLVWLRADKGGQCASDDVCGEFLQRLSPKDRELITESVCFFREGQRIPEPKQGVVLFGAFFIVTSRTNRDDVLRVSRILQREFSIPVTSV